jgi:hypothetical protein
VIASAAVVAIYWGSEWSGTGAGTASTMNGFFQNFGTTGEYKTVQQYGIQTGLQASSWVDSSNNPPTNATDAAVQGEVLRYLSTHGLSGDPTTIYEVFLPSTSYASYGIISRRSSWLPGE